MTTPVIHCLVFPPAVDEVAEIGSLERGILFQPQPEAGSVLYVASFEETEDKFGEYQTAQFLLYSLLLVLAWWIGLLTLLCLLVRRLRSLPCFGVLKKDKCVLLPCVADVVVEQASSFLAGWWLAGYLRYLFSVYSLRIENVGVRRPPSHDVQIQGIANLSALRKPCRLLRDLCCLTTFTNAGDLVILQKLEEVVSSVKRVQNLLEEQQSQTSEHNA